MTASHESTSLLDRVNDLENQLNDVEGLVAALEIVSWELCEAFIEDSRLANLRSAVIALSAALERVVKDGAHTPSTSTSHQGEAA